MRIASRLRTMRVWSATILVATAVAACGGSSTITERVEPSRDPHPPPPSRDVSPAAAIAPVDVEPEPAPESEAVYEYRFALDPPREPDPVRPAQLGDFEEHEALQVFWDRLSHCTRGSHAVPTPDMLDGYSARFTVRSEADRLVATLGDYGNGRGAWHAVQTTVIAVGRCGQVAHGSYIWADGMLSAWATVDEGTPSALAGTVVEAEVAEPTSPRHAWGRFLVTWRCGHDTEAAPVAPWQVRARGLEAQPWFDGRPVEATAAYFADETLAAMGAPRHDTNLAEADDATGKRTSRLPAPRRVRTLPEGQVWAVSVGGRYGGLALFQYDPGTDRHRVLTLTRGCGLGGPTVTWFAQGEGLLLGRTPPPDGDDSDRAGIVIVDLRGGEAYRFDAAQRARGRRFGIQLSGEGTSERITLADLRRTISPAPPALPQAILLE